MKYFFILGRNLELSLAEIVCYLEKTGNKILSLEKKKNSVLIDVEKELDENVVDFFGGVIGFGKVLKEFKGVEDLEEVEVYYSEKNKFNYVIWDFSDFTDDVRDFLKQRFKQDKLKAVEKKLTGRVKIQQGKELENLNSNLVDEEFFVFDNFFGKINQRCDYENIEKRDMKKPVRRSELAISPRLAKIMINLSGIEKGEKLLDCFCGVGVVLQEALLQDVKVVGVDKDKKAIDSCEKNLKWFGFDKENYFLINSDSQKVKLPKCDVLVSEPDFGTLKKMPTIEKAEKTLRNFESLMIEVLNNCKKIVKKRFVFSAPYIKTLKDRKGCDIERILKKTGLRLVENEFFENGIKEFRKDKIVGREIFILQK